MAIGFISLHQQSTINQFSFNLASITGLDFDLTEKAIQTELATCTTSTIHLCSTLKEVLEVLTLIIASNNKVITINMGRNKATVILKTGRFDNIDSAVIISSASKAVQSFALPCLHC